MSYERAMLPQLLDLIQEHAGIGSRLQEQIIRSAHKVQAACTLIAEVDNDLRQIAQGHRDLSRSTQMMLRAVRDCGMMALPPVRQATGRIETMVEENDGLLDDTTSASALLQHMASQLAMIASVLGDRTGPGCPPLPAAARAPAAGSEPPR